MAAAKPEIILHAWYSEKQEKMYGTFVYKKKDGTLINATSVTETKDHGSIWDDIKYIGTVDGNCFVQHIKSINK